MSLLAVDALQLVRDETCALEMWVASAFEVPLVVAAKHFK